MVVSMGFSRIVCIEHISESLEMRKMGLTFHKCFCETLRYMPDKLKFVNYMKNLVQDILGSQERNIVRTHISYVLLVGCFQNV